MISKSITGDLTATMQALESLLQISSNYDLVSRVIIIGGRRACYYFVDGFCKDEVTEKLLEQFLSITEEEMPKQVDVFVSKYIPYIEVSLTNTYDTIIQMLLSGVFLLVIESYQEAILIDARTYPARSVEEPEKDKALRGSRDGFVETIVMNTALIRRRIRSPHLRMELLTVGSSSKTDVVLCYMENRVNQQFLDRIKNQISKLQIDALSMNQESLAEALYKGRAWNPFPKFKYTGRPDTAASQVLEGSLILLVDNSPSVMITPTTLFDLTQEVDDYYFPPITGTYLRLSRTLIGVLTYLLTPTFLLFIQSPELIPANFSFIVIEEVQNIPLFFQFLILELAIDGLRLASVNTPSMLSTPLSIMAALILGEFSVNSGWFNGEALLYMAFVAIGSYTQPSFELGYAIKFYRILTLCTTQLFGIVGYGIGILSLVVSLLLNRTISHTSYVYPLIPFSKKVLLNQLLRRTKH